MNAAPRTPGREGAIDQAENGYLYCGQAGAGHFVKMVHNGIEYGMMASLAEGLNILRNADIGKRIEEGDAETAPLSNPECYQYDFDIAEVAEVWRRGSVIGSWLLDLTAIALHESPTLKEFSGRVSDSGEGRWTSIAAIDEGCPRRCSPPRCSPASPPATSTTSQTRRCRRCASSSAATRRNRPTSRAYRAERAAASAPPTAPSVNFTTYHRRAAS